MNTGTAIITVSAVALFIATVYAVIAFLRLVAGRVWSSVVLQLIVWAGGIAGVWWFSATQLGVTISINGLTFRSMNTATKFLIGFNFASVAAAFRDFLTAHDTTTSVALPALFWPRRTAVPAPAAVIRAVDPGPVAPAPTAAAVQPQQPPQQPVAR